MSKLMCMVDIGLIFWATLTSKPGDPVLTVPYVVVIIALALTGCAMFKEHLDEVRYRKSRRYLEDENF